jgi:homoserine kinase type II
VETARGSFVLRVYVNTRDPQRVQYEHAILLALQPQGLSFRVPAPVRTRSGGTFTTLDDGSLAALFDLLPGAPPDRTNLQHIHACGAALAELHKALQRLTVTSSPDLDLPTYGDLERIHPLVPDPWSLPAALPLEAAERTHLTHILDNLRVVIPTLYATLPTQLCHSDYSPGNTLFTGERLSAILDFEFAGPDVRAIDVIVGCYWSVGSRWGSGTELPTIRAFLSGYATRGALTTDERTALPTLARLSAATSLVHWTGRHRAQLATTERLREQIARLLDLDRWLTSHAAVFNSSIVRFDSTERPSASTSFSPDA